MDYFSRLINILHRLNVYEDEMTYTGDQNTIRNEETKCYMIYCICAFESREVCLCEILKM